MTKDRYKTIKAFIETILFVVNEILSRSEDEMVCPGIIRNINHFSINHNSILHSIRKSSFEN